MELTVLGSGDAFGNGGRFNTSFLISDEGEHVLVDCGTTTLLRLKQEKFSLHDVSTIILSHFHGDHFGGVPFLLICALFEDPREGPLTIVGPEGVRERVLALQEMMYPGTGEKLSALDLVFVEYEEEGEISVADKFIQAYKVEHSPESNPHGFRLKWKEKVFAFSGDTSMTKKLFNLADNADVFVCECNFMKGVNFGHLSYEEISEIKDQLSCKQLWLSHMNEEVYQSEEVAINKLKDGLKIQF